MTLPELAHAHFTHRLAVETDADDVAAALRDGTVDFILVDTRSPAPTPPAHLPGAVSLPRRGDHQESSTRCRRPDRRLLLGAGLQRGDEGRA